MDGEDIIKNFRVVQYEDPVKGIFTNKDAIDSGKLRLAYSQWNIADNSIQLLRATESDDQVELKYLITLTNKMYAYTSVSLYQSASVFCPTTTTHQSCHITSSVVNNYDYYITQNAYYFGGAFLSTGVGGAVGGWSAPVVSALPTIYPDIATWNGQNNRHIYTGTFVFNFELNDQPFLSPINTDGASYDPIFSYIAPYSAFISNNSNGVTTISDLQDIADDYGTQFAYVKDPQTSGERAASNGDKSSNYAIGDWSWSWNANPTFSSPQVSRSFSGNVYPTPINQPLTMTRQNGDLLWNATEGYGTSVKDIQMRLPLGTLSPSVLEYKRSFSYTYSQNYIGTLLGFVISDNPSTVNYLKPAPSALEIKNRYVMYDVSLEVLVTTKYNIDGVYRQLDQVQKPEEYYYDLIYSSGFGGAISGSTSYNNFADDLLNWLLMLLIIIVAIIATIIVLRYILKRKSKQKIVILQKKPK